MQPDHQCAYLVVTSALAGPRVVSANIVQVPNDGLGQVTVIFSDDMDAVTLTNLSHYRLSGSPVLGVFKPHTFPNAIVLQTSMLECGRTYELVLTGLQDGSARFLNPNPTIISLTTTGLAYCAQSYDARLAGGILIDREPA
jgi:hypothetical protein